MLSLQTSTRLYIYRGAADMRRSIDGLAALARDLLGEEPTGNHAFIFGNRRGDRLKVLFWDGNGFCLLYKRLERGRFSLPQGGAGRVEISESTFRLLLGGLSLERVWTRAENAS